MTDVFTIRPQRRAPSAALVPYVLITFAIAWGIIGLYIFRPEQAVAWFGEITGTHPLYVMATWAPAFAAFAVVCFFGGGAGLKAYLTRLALWRCSIGWGVFLLIGVPLTFAAGALVKGTLTDPLPFDSLGSALALMGFMLFLGPVEEFGWRGVAQPLLQRHVAPIWAGLLIGATWGFWHFPAFYLSGTVYTDWSFLPFFIGNVTLAVIVTPLFNVSRGSILLPALFHFQLINPLWPDAQPYDTWFFVLVAVVVVWVNRKTMFTREGAVTEVIPGASRYNRREPPVVSSPTSFASTLSSRLRASGSALVGFLFPGDAERDPGFKEEIRRRSLRGVYILVGVTAFMPFLALLFHGLASLFEPEPQMSSPSTLVLLTLAGCALAATRTEQGRRHARPLAFAMGIGVSAILTWSNIFEDPGDTATAVLESLIDVMVVLIVALAAIPARPLQMFAFGLILIWIDLALASLAASQGLLETPPAHYYSGGHLIAVFCGALSGLTYQLLHNSYLGQRERLATQSRLLHSETAMSFVRLSATLSHELNSPLGTLRSSVASLQTLAAKQDAPEANKERMRGLQRDLFDVSEKAVDKISKAVDLIQRFTNLDRAEVTQVEVDKMLQDVAQMVRAEDEAGSEIRLTTTTMPAVKLKPQPISSVFSRLMHNAVKASAGRGPVEVSAGRENDEILVSVRDHGEGLSSQELSELFQPGFRTRDGRVEASKWGLFTARQVIREHGGDISATRADNGGTRIVVRLPVDRATGSISE